MAQKTETLAIRITPELKEMLRAIATQERRSMANMLEVMIAEWCQCCANNRPANFSIPKQN